MEHFRSIPKTDINSTAPSRQLHTIFQSFLSDYSKQDAATNTANSKNLISFLKAKKVMTTLLSTIYKNTDGYAEQYRCASALYFMSVMSQCYSIIIDRGISTTDHGKVVVDGINYVDKRYIYQLMSTVRLPRINRFYSHMKMHTFTKKYDVSLAK